ncbi:RidA family protein [Pectinatus frisingensis]|uniref:RidA family protein n=1 Tax=Pectinatus frisingensis TaxID=865 RepID=UPI0018C563EF|nr:RidA family protein [Pectinatus frisingensis]
MHKTILTTSKAPGAIGPYSQGVRANGFVFISGQLPIDPATGEFAGNTTIEQTKQSLLNIKHILESEDIALNDVVKTTVLLKDINDFAAMNEVYAGFFKKDCPARSAFQVAALPKDALVEIEVIAAER